MPRARTRVAELMREAKDMRLVKEEEERERAEGDEVCLTRQEHHRYLAHVQFVTNVHFVTHAQLVTHGHRW